MCLVSRANVRAGEQLPQSSTTSSAVLEIRSGFSLSVPAPCGHWTPRPDACSAYTGIAHSSTHTEVAPMRRTLLIALLSFAVVTLVSAAVGCGSQPSHRAARGESSRGDQSARADQTAGRAQPISQTENDQLTVYVTESGERYHLSSCRTLRGGGHPISLADAKRRGYTPCRVCQPPR